MVLDGGETRQDVQIGMKKNLVKVGSIFRGSKNMHIYQIRSSTKIRPKMNI